jgi:hypothetical protein
MLRSRRRAASCRAVVSAAHSESYSCQPLERRVLLDASDPVLVLVEPVQDYRVDDVLPYLWTSTVEFPFDPHVNGQPGPDGVDRDGNGYPDDAYGWNFTANSPIWAVPNTADGHGTIVTAAALNVLNEAPQTLREHVKVMYVIGGGGISAGSSGPSQALQYILNRKSSGAANVVAVASAFAAGSNFTNRAGAELLSNAGIMLIGGQSNDPVNFDGFLGDPGHTFYGATPRFGVQAAALDNVIPVTTDFRELNQQGNPIITGHGINSFYGGIAGEDMQSFSGPAAAAMATVAARAYQNAHSGRTRPSSRSSAR